MQLKKANNTMMTEKQYRSIKDRLSYSSIKLFDNDRKKFYNEFILGEKREEKPSTSTTMGQLVHTLLSGEDFDEKFHIAVSVEPKGQMLELVNNLYLRSLKTIVDGIQTDSFETLFMDAVATTKYDFNMQEVAFKGKDATKILGMFTGDAEIYYNEKLSAIGKMVVSVPTIQQAEKLVEKIKGHSFTMEYANAISANDVEVFNEMPVLFEIGEVPYKSLVDKVIVNHKAKTIQPIDWKTSWDNEDPSYAYLKFGYYIQAAMYDMALNNWKNDNNMIDYVLHPMKFIFCDTGGFSDPVVLNINSHDILRGLKGFTVRGYKYRGLDELVTDIQWHVETGIWSTSKAIADKKGNIKLDILYGE